MKLFTHHRNKPFFLWLTLVATTVLLVVVIVVQVRENNSPVEEPIQFVATDIEQQYSDDVRALLQEYMEAVIDFDVENDNEQWLELVEVLQEELLAMMVPQRMQTLHLNAVLQIGQAKTALTQENTSFLSSHRAELDTILAALSYE